MQGLVQHKVGEEGDFLYLSQEPKSIVHCVVHVVAPRSSVAVSRIVGGLTVLDKNIGGIPWWAQRGSR
jgi:hypothetical protein